MCSKILAEMVRSLSKLSGFIESNWESDKRRRHFIEEHEKVIKKSS